MSTSAPRVAILVGAFVLVLVGGAARAWADRPSSPSRLVDSCKSEPGSALCREVRRLCATKAVRDDVVPACRELGWYGDTVYREIVNLCPIDPGHADCERMKATCERGAAESVGDEGARICREMGWGEYAYTTLGGGGEGGEGEGGSLGGVEGGTFGGVEGGSFGGGGGGAAGAGGPVMTAAGGPMLNPPTWHAGAVGIGLRVGFVDDAARYDGHENVYSGFVSATRLSFTRWPVGAAFAADFGRASGGGFVYDADVFAGLGHWWSTHLAAGLLAGVGVSGVDDGVPFAVDLPVRLVGVAHAGDALTMVGWAQVEWFAATEESRRSGSPTLGFADAAELGASVVWGHRGPANGRYTPSLWLGGLYQEQNGTSIVSVVVGFGAAQNPWNL